MKFFQSGYRRTAFLCAITIFITGCAGLTPHSGSGQSATSREAVRETARTFHDTIELSGRLSVRYQQNGKDEAVHGNFTWRQKPELTTIVLLSPLGQTLATIDVAPGMSTLTQAGQAPRVAANVDALAAEALGWPLPVSGLRTWLQGFGSDANGKSFAATRQNTGAAAVKTGDGWRVDYANWQADDTVPEQTRPKRIDLERSTAQAGNVSLRIVIDTWQVR